MQTRNIPRNLNIYTKRLVYANKTNSPFISGDVFVKASDLSFSRAPSGIKISGAASLREAKVVFCSGDILREVLEDFGTVLSPQVLIVGNSDQDFTELDFKIPKRTKRLFIQNSTIFDPRVTSIPIGIENLRLGKNGLPNLFKQNSVSNQERSKVLFGPFSLTHPSREYLTKELTLDPEVFDIQLHPLSTKKFAAKSFASLAVVCPRGNGLDTHRTWESLYRGSYPIVIRDNMTESFVKLGIPLFQLQSWEELYSLKRDLQKVFLPFNPTNIPALWWPFWNSLIRNEVG